MVKKSADPTEAAQALADDPNTAAVVEVTDPGFEGQELAADDPAVTGVPRDELHDSVDRHTGTLTEEAVALRAEQASAAAE